MPRTERKTCESCIYHVMLRGINQSQLFYDNEDKVAFLSRLERYKKECGFEIYAWSLMGNHVHLIIKTKTVNIGAVMKKIELSYSHYYNFKYDRNGYLFQDRFKSKPIENEEYLLAALRYIHRNPIEIGKAISYWTSFNDYLGGSALLDADFCLGLFSSDLRSARNTFKKFVEDESPEVVPYDFETKGVRISDRHAVEIICSLASVKYCQELSSMERKLLLEIIPSIRSKGVSIRQISRLSGLSRSIVQRCK